MAGGLTISIDPRSSSNLRRMSDECPSLFRQCSWASARTFRKRLRDVLYKGGNYGVPPVKKRWSKTATLRRLTGRKPSSMFGKFGKSAIVFYKDGDAQVIGWHDNVAEFVENKLQKGESHIMTSGQRSFLGRYLKDSQIPEMYDRPERNIIDPFGRYTAREYPGQVAKVFEARFKKKYGKEW